MAHYFVVPKVHVQREFVIRPFDAERRHVADYVLHRCVYRQTCKKKVGEQPVLIAGFFIAVVFRLALDTGNFAAFICVWIGIDYSGVEPYLRVEPSVAVRRIFLVIFHKEHHAAGKLLRSLRRFKNTALPVIEAASWDSGYAA